MNSRLALYAAGRLGFGAAAMLAPGRVGALLLGPEGHSDPIRPLMASYGTRDVLLGAGLVHALAADRSPRPWLAAGCAADVLDVAVQLKEREAIPDDKLVPGLLFAGLAAVAGGVLLKLD